MRSLIACIPYSQHLCTQTTGSLAVTSEGLVYMKLRTGVWTLQFDATAQLGNTHANRLSPNDSANVQRGNAAGQLAVCILHQHEYVAHQSRLHTGHGWNEPVWSGCLPLSSALDQRSIHVPYWASAPIGFDVGERMSIRLGPCEVEPPIPGLFFRRPQDRARPAKDATPITYQKLFYLIAKAVIDLMENHRLFHNGRQVTYDRLCILQVEWKSRGSIQPLLGVYL
ncbi:hypothetical protein BC628DRAFT_827960 [Trametes gibbosa]|nr:hypothetical protein BC628DRAFT_827960 [Trametes gibbosa]